MVRGETPPASSLMHDSGESIHLSVRGSLGRLIVKKYGDTQMWERSRAEAICGGGGHEGLTEKLGPSPSGASLKRVLACER